MSMILYSKLKYRIQGRRQPASAARRDFKVLRVNVLLVLTLGLGAVGDYLLQPKSRRTRRNVKTGAALDSAASW